MTTAITGKTYVNAGVRLPPCHDRGVTSGAGTTDLAALRVPLTGYCYRMLGSSADAEDATQETLLRAYTRLDTFDPTRARLSTWVHAIATNICLDMLRAAQRRMLHWEGPATAFDPDAVLPDQHWISPAPDSHTLGADPADIVTRRDTVRLAFLAALQHLPPTQRAALVLREVLAFTAAETADILDTTPAAINSALQRARATLRTTRDTPTALDPDAPHDRDLLQRYIAAFEAHDITALTAVLHEDARVSMPPFGWRLDGGASIAAVMTTSDACRGDRVLPVTFNGAAGAAQYRLDEDGVARPFALVAFETLDGRIARLITFFGSGPRFPEFGLPTVLT
ncbi:RNA polymerase subunit sigma-70 [Nocardia salmonicida]|uniref:RNA polymerase subunit sigma-70 n=1 Tax=Nocardia salmonicida TaxID=53431 RepID=UPI00340AEB89